MQIDVDGLRASASEWDAVREIPPNELPPLTEAQRHVAQKLHVREEDYARSALAMERTRAQLQEKAVTVATLLQNEIQSSYEGATLLGLRLLTAEHRFDAEVIVGAQRRRFSIKEDLIDDLLQGGSVEAKQRFKTILGIALQGRLT